MTEFPERHKAMPSLVELPGFLLDKLSPGGRKALLAGLGMLALALVALAIVLLPKIGDDKRAADEAFEARKAAAQKARRARQVREQTPRTAMLATGAALAPSVERAIVFDADRRARTGELDKAPIEATCERVGPGPAPGSAAFECIAATIRIPANQVAGDTSGLIGYPYRAVADPRVGEITICKITGQAGEGGLDAGRSVALDPSCLASSR